MNLTDPLLVVENLNVTFRGQDRPIVDNVSFALQPGDVLGLVGESGSGKTTVALSLLGYRHAAAFTDGKIHFLMQDVLALPLTSLTSIRGRHISFVPQNPTTALNPARKIGSIFREFLRVHGISYSVCEADSLTERALLEFDFNEPDVIMRRFPHQLSGGQQQRIVLALATICKPALLVLDEPTTGLDVSTQKTVLEFLGRLRKQHGTTMVYVTHDLSVIKEVATHVGVLYAGCLVELGQLNKVFGNPLHPYTWGLLNSRPSLRQPTAISSGLRGLLRREELPTGCPFSPRCEYSEASCSIRSQNLEDAASRHFIACQRWREISLVRGTTEIRHVSADHSSIVLEAKSLSVSYHSSWSLSVQKSRPVLAVDDVTFQLHRGEILAVVGESGSGKSTLAKLLAGLIRPSFGKVEIGGMEVRESVSKRLPEQRRNLQLIFQNPDSSLNPRLKIGQILKDAISSFENAEDTEISKRVEQNLDEVRLPKNYSQRYPDELSGGERQRVAIARALIVNPEVIICDEILSALDVSVQAGILDLLRSLCNRRGLSLLFISHDLAVVRALASRIAVMYRGQVIAFTTSDDLLKPPLHPYLHKLLEALPGESIVDRTPVMSPRSSTIEIGCPYSPRCSLKIDGVCNLQPAPWQGGASRLRCHQSSSFLASTLLVKESENL